MLGGGLVALAAGIEQILVIRIIRIIDDVVHLLLAGLDACAAPRVRSSPTMPRSTLQSRNT